MSEEKPFLSDRMQYVIGAILSVVIALVYILLTEERGPVDPEPAAVTSELTGEQKQ